ncbi:MAG: WYL domain-containing protein [Blautia sp.]|nr:WYL domain-containing protein [Blautia sp.]MDY5030506.1 WYL domain-containing protein [Blautia sp.]
MAKSNNQKAKILYLEKLLYGTGENDTITMQDILEELQKHGIRAERKSIYDDFAVLREFGMDIRYRRGRDGGYYLADGCKGAVRLQEVAEEGRPQQPAEHQEKPEEKQLQEPDREGWMHNNSAGTSKKQMKLLCAEGVREQVHRYFGDSAQYKEKYSGYFTVTADYIEDHVFFGWLTAMGTDVHLMKPKKAVQAYREYLKSLAREYKGL